MIEATARVVDRNYGALRHRMGFLILDGDYKGIVFCDRDYRHDPIGTIVRVRFCPDDQFASVVPAVTRKSPAVAIVEVTARLTVRVVPHPPKKGELGWQVSAGADAREMLAQVIDGRGNPDDGVCGYGWWAEMDHEEFAEDEEGYPGRNITLIVEYEEQTVGEIRLL